MGEKKENRNEFLEAQAHIWNHTFKYINSMSLKCVSELGIPDVLHNHGHPMSLSQLVEALQIHPSKAQSLARLMRLLVHSGFFSQTLHQQVMKYGLTPSSRFLLCGNNTTTATSFETLPFLFLALHHAMVAPWESMSSWLRSGEYVSAFEMVNGKSIWKYIEDEPSFGSLVHQTMVYDSQLIGKLLGRKEFRAVFEGMKSMVDVGGEGIMAKAIVAAFPHINCTVLDLPYQTTKDLNVNGEGNLFEAIQIPPTDIVWLKSILHKCNDEESLRILKKCKGAIMNNSSGREGRGKVIIIEAVLEKENQMEDEESIETQLCGDVLMMATFNTTKRNEKEWKTLFLAAGFSHYNITSFLGLRSLIELYP